MDHLFEEKKLSMFLLILLSRKTELQTVESVQNLTEHSGGFCYLNLQQVQIASKCLPPATNQSMKHLTLNECRSAVGKVRT
jgi:hypothetical protein